MDAFGLIERWAYFVPCYYGCIWSQISGGNERGDLLRPMFMDAFGLDGLFRMSRLAYFVPCWSMDSFGPGSPDNIRTNSQRTSSHLYGFIWAHPSKLLWMEWAYFVPCLWIYLGLVQNLLRPHSPILRAKKKERERERLTYFVPCIFMDAFGSLPYFVPCYGCIWAKILNTLAYFVPCYGCILDQWLTSSHILYGCIWVFLYLPSVSFTLRTVKPDSFGHSHRTWLTSSHVMHLWMHFSQANHTRSH